MQLKPRRQAPSQANVLDDLVLAVMLFDDLGVPGCLERGALASFAAQVDDIGLKLLLEIERMKFQFFDVQEHCETSAPTSPTQCC